MSQGGAGGKRTLSACIRLDHHRSAATASRKDIQSRRPVAGQRNVLPPELWVKSLGFPSILGNLRLTVLLFLFLGPELFNL